MYYACFYTLYEVTVDATILIIMEQLIRYIMFSIKLKDVNNCSKGLT